MIVPAMPVLGGCLCGAVRYASEAPPERGFYCHCTMCQKAYGGPFMAGVKFGGGAFALTVGELRYYRSSPFGRRGFCAACGSPIAFRYDGNPAFWVLLGSLDRPGDWPLTADAAWGEVRHVCIEGKVAWLRLEGGLEQGTSDDLMVRAAAIAHATATVPTSIVPCGAVAPVALPHDAGCARSGVPK